MTTEGPGGWPACSRSPGRNPGPPRVPQREVSMPPPPAPAELVSAIAELKDDFQRVADQHPWVCLAIPQGESPFLLVGEAVHIYAETHPGIYGVDTPRHPACRVVADHVERLTRQAGH